MTEQEKQPEEATELPDPSPQQDTDANPMDQTLVAYLDGELTETETAEVESRLAIDGELRGRLRELQLAWDMLDELPQMAPDRSFLKSTIEMVVTTSRKKKTRWHRWPLRVAAVAIAFGLAATIAFQVVRYRQNEPYRAFVADLDFLENVDMYDSVDSIEFLEQLYAEGVFVAEEELTDEP